MANATWEVCVDLNSDGDFSDSGEDISAYFISLKWQIGFAKPFDPIARDSTATIILKNDDKRFSPESGSVFSANWTRGKKIRIRSTDPAGPTTRTMYIGWIRNIVPSPNTKGTRICTVMCHGFFDRAQPVESFVTLQTNVTADSVIGSIVGNGNIYPPGLPLRWLLGVPGSSEIGQTTYLGATSDWISAETGKTIFQYIADQWRNTVSVLGALRDTVGREYGRLWIDRSGIMQFINRHHLILDATSDESFSNSMSEMEYTFGEEIVNKVTVRAKPRKIGVSPEVLARIDSATPVPASSSVTVSFRYSDLTASGAKIGGRNAITPVASTDYTANTQADGTGSDATGNITATIMQESATRVTVRFTSSAGQVVYIQAGAQLRATAVRDFGEIDYVYEDSISEAAYGLYPYTYPFTMDNFSDAQGIAQYIGTSRNTPRGTIKAITLRARASATRLTSALTRTVLDRITVTETQTGTSDDYFIIGETHSVGPGKEYTVTWSLEPAGAYNYWVLGISTLGISTYLGPL